MGRMSVRWISCAAMLSMMAWGGVAHAKAVETGGYAISGFTLGDWSKIAGFPLGFQTSNIITPNPDKPLRIRSLVGLMYNFSRTVNVPQQNYGNANDLLQLTTKNTSVLFGIGPEFGPSKGDSQPFVYGTVGFDTYWTSSNLAGTVNGKPYYSSNGDSRIGFAWAAGLGIRKVVGHGEKLELSAEYRSGNGHRYLKPDQITTTPGNDSPTMSRDSRSTDQIVIRLGSTLGQ